MSKEKRILKNIIILISIYLIILSVGYAYFNESLSINGISSTAEFYQGPTLPTEPIVLDTTNNRYSTESKHKDFLDFDSESWNGDTYTVSYRKRIGLVAGTVTSTYTIAFTNPTTLDFTEGNIKTDVTFDNAGNISNCSGAISKTVLKPGERCDVSITLTHNFWQLNTRQEVVAHITFKLQNQVKNLYFKINFIRLSD